MRQLPEAFKKAQARFRGENRTDAAATLTYFGVLALFPALLVFVALLSLFGEYPRTYNAVVEIITSVASKETVGVVTRPLKEVLEDKGGAGAILGVGILGSLWAASGYLGAFMRTGNLIDDVTESRSFLRLRATQLLLTVLALLAATICGIGLVLSGDFASAIGKELGISEAFLPTWNVLKWPLLILALGAMLAFLYRYAPDCSGRRRFRIVTWGSLTAVVVWGAASFLFSLYVANFGSYSATYGSLGAIITFLVWLWIGNIAILFGAELDAQIKQTAEKGKRTADEQK